MSRNGLVEWFLSQSGVVGGFTKAIFSGLTTDELVRVMIRHVFPRPQLQGLYQVSTAPIDKRALLELVKNEYEHPVEIVPDDTVVIDRSLDSTRFREATGYSPPSWPALIKQMRELETATPRI
jgi:dTDP-4-dehydrorhamnose reductase